MANAVTRLGRAAAPVPCIICERNATHRVRGLPVCLTCLVTDLATSVENAAREMERDRAARAA